MDAIFLLKGMVIGFSIAAPVGPIGILCIRRSLANGMAIGFASGLGAATADATYGSIAAFGLTAISGFLVRQQFWLALIGGLFLCYLGVRTFIAKPAENPAQARDGNLWTAWSSTFFLTLTNPATILSFVAVFAGFGLGAATDYLTAAVLVLGVFLGSALWWFILSGGVGLLRSRVTNTWMRAINFFSGAILFAFGCYALTRI